MLTRSFRVSSLIAEVPPRLWERRPEEALAEMRSLLLELRPTALMEADLSERLRHLADAFTGRARIPVEHHITDSFDLPPDVKVAFYRIA